MLTQPKKWPGYLAAGLLAWYAVNNPEKAADLINKIGHALATIANGIG
jgi:hypothetical protein